MTGKATSRSIGAKEAADPEPSCQRREGGSICPAPFFRAVSLDGGAAIGEGRAIAGIEIALRRQPRGEQNIVVREFDTKVGDTLAWLLRDGGAGDEVANGDEHAVDEYGMIEREERSRRGVSKPQAPAEIRTGQTSLGRGWW